MARLDCAASDGGLHGDRLTRSDARRPARLGVASIVTYLVAVGCVEVLRHSGVVTAADLAATPDAIADLKLWRLVTSAFVVSGPPVLELLGLTAATTLLIRRRPVATFWRAALAGHIGGTLLAYAAVGALWIASSDAVTSVVDQPDYGVSAVWLAVLGALLVDSLCPQGARRTGLRNRLVTVTCLLAAIIGFVFFPLLGASEHLIAFVAGMLVVATMRSPIGYRRARPASR